MFRVLVCDKLDAAGVDLLRQQPQLEVVIPKETLKGEELKNTLQEFDGIILRSETKLKDETLLQGQKRLKVIVRAGVGVDNINLSAATAAGILVMNTPAGNTTSTAEHAIALMLALSRNIAPADATMKAGKWDRGKFTGKQLAGKTLGVVALGRIGQSVAKRAQGLEMKVVGYDPFLSPEIAARLGIEYFLNLDEMLPHCDYITVHPSMTPETVGMINAERIAKMKPGVRLINCARGGIIDETALLAALESGQVAGAALDVFVNEPPKDSPLPLHPKVLATPHLGASTEEAQELVAVEAAEITIAYLLKKEVRYAMNMAPVSGAEMAEIRQYLNLSFRLGLLLAQLNKSSGLTGAKIHYRGEVAGKNVKLMTACFTAGLLDSACDESVNMINAESVAARRGLKITESTSPDQKDFSSMISATLYGADGGTLVAAGTVFGKEYLRLVRLGEFHLDAFLDGNLLIYRHLDRPGQIGRIGSILGSHQVNIANMSLGRKSDHAGGDSVAILHLDDLPGEAALQEIASSPDVTGVDVVTLPGREQPLPWLSAN